MSWMSMMMASRWLTDATLILGCDSFMMISELFLFVGSLDLKASWAMGNRAPATIDTSARC
jgi:hypothetical protein